MVSVPVTLILLQDYLGVGQVLLEFYDPGCKKFVEGLGFKKTGEVIYVFVSFELFCVHSAYESFNLDVGRMGYPQLA